MVRYTQLLSAGRQSSEHAWNSGGGSGERAPVGGCAASIRTSRLLPSQQTLFIHPGLFGKVAAKMRNGKNDSAKRHQTNAKMLAGTKRCRRKQDDNYLPTINMKNTDTTKAQPGQNPRVNIQRNLCLFASQSTYQLVTFPLRFRDIPVTPMTFVIPRDATMLFVTPGLWTCRAVRMNRDLSSLKAIETSLSATSFVTVPEGGTLW